MKPFAIAGAVLLVAGCFTQAGDSVRVTGEITRHQDDLRTDPTGNAGGRAACGIIRSS